MEIHARTLEKFDWLRRCNGSITTYISLNAAHRDFFVVRWKAVHRMRSDAQLNLNLLYLVELVASRGVQVASHELRPHTCVWPYGCDVDKNDIQGAEDHFEG
jgi:hypothetical protein